jgi:hypothetical protein
LEGNEFWNISPCSQTEVNQLSEEYTAYIFSVKWYAKQLATKKQATWRDFLRLNVLIQWVVRGSSSTGPSAVSLSEDLTACLKGWSFLIISQPEQKAEGLVRERWRGHCQFNLITKKVTRYCK